MIIILILTLSCIIGKALTAPVIAESKAVIENYENNINDAGNYNFSFKTSNGIDRSEQGNIANPGSTDEHITVRGHYSYIDHDGKFVLVRYYADDTGFHVLPPLPPMMAVSGGLGPNVVATLLGR